MTKLTALLLIVLLSSCNFKIDQDEMLNERTIIYKCRDSVEYYNHRILINRWLYTNENNQQRKDSLYKEIDYATLQKAKFNNFLIMNDTDFLN